jgi:hypothetical protein
MEAKHRTPDAEPKAGPDSLTVAKAEAAPPTAAGEGSICEVRPPLAAMQKCPVCGAQRRSVADHIRAKNPAADPDFVRRHPGRVVDAPVDLKAAKHVRPLAFERQKTSKSGEARSGGKPPVVGGKSHAGCNRPGHRESQRGSGEHASEAPSSQDHDYRRDGARGWHVLRDTDARWGSYPTHDPFDDESGPE